MRSWRKRAEAIPDPAVREDAIHAITEQRPHIDGAALFTILPKTRSNDLLRLLVSYEVIWDFLDNLNERTAQQGLASGLQLHLALIEALDDQTPISDFYHHIPRHKDNQYLRGLVTTCKETYTRLPSSRQLAHPLLHEARRSQVCALNHAPDHVERDDALKAWARTEFPNGHEATWFELTAAASTDLTIFALLALASNARCAPSQTTEICEAYYPWVSVLTAMLDSYVDYREDSNNDTHNYLAHYPTQTAAIERIRLLIRRCLHEGRSLTDAHKHLVIATCMFSMYLSKTTALQPESRTATRQLLASGGTLTRLLHPILRLWRRLYGLRSV